MDTDMSRDRGPDDLSPVALAWPAAWTTHNREMEKLPEYPGAIGDPSVLQQI